MAKVGVTCTVSPRDSMDAIQKKLDKYNILYFTPGKKYTITKQLVIPSDRELYFDGAILQRKGNIQSIFINKVERTSTGYNAAGNIKIAGGIFEGFGGYSYDNLITFFHAHDILIRGCTFKDTLCHAIEINSSKNVMIHTCSFTGYNLQSADYKYREIIQIDFATVRSFVLKGSNVIDPCYDGTCCDKISIMDCNFTRSEYRDYPYACIGGHAQPLGGGYHTNINIDSCDFECKPGTDQYCFSFIAMRNVTVNQCYVKSGYPFRIYSKSDSVDPKRLDKVKAADGDGYCENIYITDSKFEGCKTLVTKKNKTKKAHRNIVMKRNEVW